MTVFLGTRRVRSAGRTSGSVEVTLPVVLHVLEGSDCRLVVRDGARPEIVLQPDVSAAHALFEDLWDKIRIGLAEIDDIGDFSTVDFTLGLFPPRHWQERPPLCYADALTVLAPRAGGAQRRGALARLVAFLAAGAAGRLDLRGALALTFGESVAYVITGTSAGLRGDVERGLAHLVFWEERSPREMGPPEDAGVWASAQAGLKRVYERFCAWQDRPEVYALDRARWGKALTIEAGLPAPAPEKAPVPSITDRRFG